MDPLRRALAALCITQVTSWGVLYYAFPVMVPTVGQETGWSTAQSMGAFSVAALVSALAGIGVGRWIDRSGPRLVMTTGSVVGVAAVLAIASAPSLPWFYGAWVLAGLAQSMVLYTPAIIAITRWFGPHRVRALTTLTVVASLASTVFAPLTALLLDRVGWRATLVILAAVLAVVTVPLHALLLTPPWHPPTGRPAPGRGPEEVAHARRVVRGGAFVGLVVAMSAGAFGMYAATVNLVPLLTDRGMSTQLAAVALGLVGAGQLLGRLGYAPLARRTGPDTRTAMVLAAGALCVVALGWLPGPAWALVAVAVVAGVVRGGFTLLQATAVADRWGTTAFGRVNGVFAAPLTFVIALAPGGGAVLADRLGYPAAYTVLAAVTVASAGLVVALSRRLARRRRSAGTEGPGRGSRCGFGTDPQP